MGIINSSSILIFGTISKINKLNSIPITTTTTKRKKEIKHSHWDANIPTYLIRKNELYTTWYTNNLELYPNVTLGNSSSARILSPETPTSAQPTEFTPHNMGSEPLDVRAKQTTKDPPTMTSSTIVSKAATTWVDMRLEWCLSQFPCIAIGEPPSQPREPSGRCLYRHRRRWTTHDCREPPHMQFYPTNRLSDNRNVSPMHGPTGINTNLGVAMPSNLRPCGVHCSWHARYPPPPSPSPPAIAWSHRMSFLSIGSKDASRRDFLESGKCFRLREYNGLRACMTSGKCSASSPHGCNP